MLLEARALAKSYFKFIYLAVEGEINRYVMLVLGPLDLDRACGFTVRLYCARLDRAVRVIDIKIRTVTCHISHVPGRIIRSFDLQYDYLGICAEAYSSSRCVSVESMNFTARISCDLLG